LYPSFFFTAVKRIIAYSVLFFVFLFVERQISVYITLPWNFLFRFCLMFLMVLSFCHWRKPGGREVLIAFLFGTAILDEAIRFLEDYDLALRSYPDLLIEIIAALNAWLLYRHRSWVVNLASLVLLIAAIRIWGSGFIHYVAYGNASARVSIPVSDWSVIDEQGDTLRTSDYTGKLVLFDIWNTACASCFARFPMLEHIYEQHKNDTGIVIQALNVPIDRDTAGMAVHVIRKRGYTFPVTIAPPDLETILNIDAYPLVLVVKDNTIVFRGEIEELEAFLAERKNTTP
jgi:thiol-disulfide isomerase/thioredoxin